MVDGVSSAKTCVKPCRGKSLSDGTQASQAAGRPDHALPPARVPRPHRSSAASSMPPIWLNTNRLDSSTASEKIWVEYWPVCGPRKAGRRQAGGQGRVRAGPPAHSGQRPDKPRAKRPAPACMPAGGRCSAPSNLTTAQHSAQHTRSPGPSTHLVVRVDALRVQQHQRVAAAVGAAPLHRRRPHPQACGAGEAGCWLHEWAAWAEARGVPATQRPQRTASAAHPWCRGGAWAQPGSRRCGPAAG